MCDRQTEREINLWIVINFTWRESSMNFYYLHLMTSQARQKCNSSELLLTSLPVKYFSCRTKSVLQWARTVPIINQWQLWCCFDKHECSERVAYSFSVFCSLLRRNDCKFRLFLHIANTLDCNGRRIVGLQFRFELLDYASIRTLFNWNTYKENEHKDGK